MKYINMCHHPIQTVKPGCPDVVSSLEGWIDQIYHSAGSARLSTEEHDTYVVYGLPEGMPTRPEPGVAYIVSLTVALSLLAQGWPSDALRVPRGDIRLDNGTRAGACRNLARPRLANHEPAS